MSDRFMSLHCREADFKQYFEPLGFRIDGHSDMGPHAVEIINEESLYSEMPTAVPYTGRGYGSWGSWDFACDGETIVWVETGKDGGYAIRFDQGEPNHDDVKEVQRYFATDERAKKLLARTELQIAVEHALNPKSQELN